MNSSKQRWGELATELVAFSVLAASIVALWRNNVLLLFVVLIECLVALKLWHERYDVNFFLILALLGSLAEAVFVHSGVWRYANPTVLGVPLWFPLAFGTSGLTGERLARTITAMWEEAKPARVSERE